jgi:hypothetical protein
MEGEMIATYQMKASEMPANFSKFIQDMFGDQEVTVRVESGSELKREGWIVPKAEENDPFYSGENLRHLNANIEQGNAGKVVVKTPAELGINA